MLQPDTPEWVDSVTRGRKLCSQADGAEISRNWFLGDEALKIAPISIRGGAGQNGAYENLTRYANEVGVSFASLRAYRHVASKWPKDTRVTSVSWKVYQALAAHPSLIRDGMTVREAKRAVKIDGSDGGTYTNNPSVTGTPPAPEIIALIDPDDWINDSCMGDTSIVVRESWTEVLDAIFAKGPTQAEIDLLIKRVEAYCQAGR